MYAVTIEPLNSIFFLSGRPEGNEGEIQEDVDLDIPCNLYLGSDGADCSEQVLCRSVANEKHYKVFKNRKDIDPAQFQPTGKNFGGVYSRITWERFLKILPGALAIQAIPDDDPPGAIVETPLNGPRSRVEELLAGATPGTIQPETAGPDADELRRRREVGRRIEALRQRIFAEQGEMPDSIELIREDRAR
jgi:hypothetical protein